MTTPVYSYAQNREDVLLWRALQHVPPEDGRWVDVGANDPVRDSVTKLFSLRGWRGINVEPVAGCFQRLVEDRPRDVNLNCALGAEPGVLTLKRVADNSGLSTFDPALARMYAGDGRDLIEEAVTVTTLAHVAAEHLEGPCHFLKIDVEGHEAAVLSGADFTTFRPWVIVIEATYPERWRSGLEAKGYRFVLDDGLNFVFVAQEHPDLVPVLSRPVSCMDADIMYCRPSDTAGHTHFLNAMASDAVVSVLMGSLRSAPIEHAARALAHILCVRPDLTAAFCGGAAVDVQALLRWALETPADADTHLPLLADHRDALHELQIIRSRTS